MKPYFHIESHRANYSAFYIRRVKGNHGELYEIRKNKLPRGKAYRRLNTIEWARHQERLGRANIAAKMVLRELKSPS